MELAFFFEIGVENRAETSRRTQRFAMIVEGKILDVLRIDAARRRFVDDDRDGAACSAFTKRKTAAASETRVCETFQHGLNGSYYTHPTANSLRSGDRTRATP